MADKIDRKAFESMLTSAEADVTAANLFPQDDSGNKSSSAIHNALMAAGFTPGLGNIADAADALLYLLEGEYGDAAISAAAMIPIAGQVVSSKKALKAAKAAGEETVTLYRGASKWHKGEMVADGMHVSPKELAGSAGGQPTKNRGDESTAGRSDPACAG